MALMQQLSILKSGVAGNDVEDNSEAEKLMAENAKLNYRINIMKRVMGCLIISKVDITKHALS